MNNINLGQYNDPVADKTAWFFLKTPASGFDELRLVTVNKQLLKYSPTIPSVLFSGLFILVGLLFLLYGFYDRSLLLVTGGSGLVFILIGLLMIYFSFSPLLFDGKNNELVKNRGKKKKTINFSKIYAMQLISTNKDEPDVDFRNFQLNIICDSGTRYHIANYYLESEAVADVEILSEFLNAKIWHAVV